MLRQALAAILGIALGAFFVAAPSAVARLWGVGRGPRDRRGPYGENGELPTRWRRIVQAVGVALAVAGLYFGSQLF